MMSSLISPPSFACTFPRNRNKIMSSRQTTFSCEASADPGGRRNILISLAGTATATALTQGSSALASPFVTPDISECHKTIDPGMPNKGCCPPAPPTNSHIIDFEPPYSCGPLKVRRPAHLVDDEYLKKYEEAVRLMKALPLDDPRNFHQQANVHCTYCDGAYQDDAGSNIRLHVHSSWIFFPFHRLYLHFHERILGKLIGDETFALPFWNWDTPKGMSMPAIYNNRLSPLYDCNRDATHLTPTTIDLNYHGPVGKQPSMHERHVDHERLVDQNLKLMYTQMIRTGACARTFLGEPYRHGVAHSGAGVFEHLPHDAVHKWTGDPTSEHNADMGVYTLAARDPIFYAHHSNIDRLWSVWKEIGGKRKDFTDSDWLDSSFLFYDENKQLVRATVKDSLQTETLGYEYDKDVENPWLGTRPTPQVTSATHKSLLKSKKATTGHTSFPFTLHSSPRDIVLKRPKVSRDEKDKEGEEEILVIDKIEFPSDAYIKFDVYINVHTHEMFGAEASEFLGSFTNLPSGHGKKTGTITKKTTKMCLGINELLKDLDAEDDDILLVTLVPRRGKVEIGGINIEFCTD